MVLSAQDVQWLEIESNVLSPTFGVVIQPPKIPPLWRAGCSKLFRVIRRARIEVLLGQTEAATLITIKHKSTILTKRSEQVENNRAYTLYSTRIPHPFNVAYYARDTTHNASRNNALTGPAGLHPLWSWSLSQYLHIFAKRSA
jgi:hypothetical protein